MSASDVSAHLPMIDLYRRFVLLSRDMARIQIRQQIITIEIGLRLESFGGARLWGWLLLFSIAGVIVFGSRSERWAQVTAECCGIIVSYAIVLFGISGVFSEIYILAHGRAAEDFIYARVTRVIFNRVSIVIVLPILIACIAVTGFVAPSLSRQILIVITFVTLAVHLANQVNHSRKNFDDYMRLLAAILGRRSTVIRSTEQLICDIVTAIQRASLPSSQITSLLRLAESDLRHAEVQVELTNLIVGVTAILITILFSGQLGTFLSNLTLWLDGTFHSFSQIVSDLIGLGGQFALAFVNIMYVGIWWFFVNGLVGVSFVLLRALISVYFLHYRPAHALHQALVVLDQNNAMSPLAQVSPRPHPSFIIRLLEMLLK